MKKSTIDNLKKHILEIYEETSKEEKGVRNLNINIGIEEAEITIERFGLNEDEEIQMIEDELLIVTEKLKIITREPKI